MSALDLQFYQFKAAKEAERQERRAWAIKAGRTEGECDAIEAAWSDFPFCYLCGGAQLDGLCECDSYDDDVSAAEIVADNPMEVN